MSVVACTQATGKQITELHRRLVLLALSPLAALLPCAAAHAAAGSAPAAFPVVDGQVNALLVDGGTAYVGGQFSRIGPPSGPLATLDPGDAHLTRAFTSITGEQAPIYEDPVSVAAIEPDGGGGAYVAGEFDRAGDRFAAGIVHLRPDGWLGEPVHPGRVRERAGHDRRRALSGRRLQRRRRHAPRGPRRGRRGHGRPPRRLPRDRLGRTGARGGARRSSSAARSRTSGPRSARTWRGRRRHAPVTGFDPRANCGVGALAVSGDTLHAGSCFSRMGVLPRRGSRPSTSRRARRRRGSPRSRRASRSRAWRPTGPAAAGWADTGWASATRTARSAGCAPTEASTPASPSSTRRCARWPWTAPRSTSPVLRAGRRRAAWRLAALGEGGDVLPFDPNPPDWGGYALAPTGDGGLLAGGKFTTMALASVKGLARFDARAAGEAPAATEPPEVTGDPFVGGHQSASAGQWSGAPTALRTQWLRCDAAGDECSPHDDPYPLTEDDIGHRFRCSSPRRATTVRPRPPARRPARWSSDTGPFCASIRRSPASRGKASGSSPIRVLGTTSPSASSCAGCRARASTARAPRSLARPTRSCSPRPRSAATSGSRCWSTTPAAPWPGRTCSIPWRRARRTRHRRRRRRLRRRRRR